MVATLSNFLLQARCYFKSENVNKLSVVEVWMGGWNPLISNQDHLYKCWINNDLQDAAATLLPQYLRRNEENQ